MDDLTSPGGAAALAVTALLLVLGVRLVRPRGGTEWLAIAAYAGALVVQLVAARGLLGGPAPAPGAPLRILGALLLVAGLLVAGTSARGRRRAALEAAAARRPPPPEPIAAPPRALDPAYAGLAIVLVGQLLRAPSRAGAWAVGVAVLVAVRVAWTRGRDARRSRGAG